MPTDCDIQTERTELEAVLSSETFARPANFDQARDSIVRVEAHRLRKRLQEYYLQQGAGHQIQIILPPGNYVPQFIRRAVPGEPTTVVEAASVVAAANTNGGTFGFGAANGVRAIPNSGANRVVQLGVKAYF